MGMLRFCHSEKMVVVGSTHIYTVISGCHISWHSTVSLGLDSGKSGNCGVLSIIGGLHLFRC